MQALANIENNDSVPDKLLIEILMQRLGKSADKLEMILSYEMYKNEFRISTIEMENPLA